VSTHSKPAQGKPTQGKLACIILAAGKGKRMHSHLPKVMHKLAGRPMINWVLATAEALKPEKIVTVVAPDGDMVRDAVKPHGTCVQKIPQGTGDAVRAAMPALDGFDGDILVLYGDGPFYTVETLRALLDAMRNDAKAGLGYLAMKPADPTGYGRMLLGGQGYLESIVEEKDASPKVKRVDLCFSGVMCGRASGMKQWLGKLDNKNANSEYYLTDLPAIAAADGAMTVVTESPFDETLGANTKAELAVLERRIQDRLRLKAMDSGATLIDPATVYFSFDTVLGRDVTVEPNVFFGAGVKVENNAVIHAFSHLEQTVVREGASVGPFARLRPGADIGAHSKIGNFVEIKNAKLGDGVKASHLAYIGDAEVGAGVNFSCGAITVNYDGFSKKSKTVIGEGAMIGSNVNLVAPVTIGAGAYIAAGTTVSKDIPGDALAVAREKPTIIEGWATKKRPAKKG
jgi:bifunctional UDP-N-acetylglucosamine pyrophosphorylase/glucosamine-1-phosphate N-acetyltransferase